MAEQNLHLNKLLSDPVYFSDLCNGVLFRGRLYLRPEDLMPVKGSQGVLYAAALYRYAQENRTELRDMDGTAKLALLSMMGEQKRLQKMMEEAGGEEEFDMCKAIDDLIADGESRGFERGDKSGFERGERQLSSLISRLLAKNRPDLIALAVSDPDVRVRLYKSYNL